MTAFRACYADLKIIKSRSVAQVILEIPLEQADAALLVLGGVPRPDQEVWVGVARLAKEAPTATPRKRRPPGPCEGCGVQEGSLHEEDCPVMAANLAALQAPTASPEAVEQPKERKRFDELPLPSQAALLCQDERFRTWAESFWRIGAPIDEDGAAFLLRGYCCIKSRSELKTDTSAAQRFIALVARYRRETGMDTWSPT